MRLIEVKSTADKGLKHSQKIVIDALKKKDITVEIILRENLNRPRRYPRTKTVV